MEGKNCIYRWKGKIVYIDGRKKIVGIVNGTLAMTFAMYHVIF